MSRHLPQAGGGGKADVLYSEFGIPARYAHAGASLWGVTLQARVDATMITWYGDSLGHAELVREPNAASTRFKYTAERGGLDQQDQLHRPGQEGSSSSPLVVIARANGPVPSE